MNVLLQMTIYTIILMVLGYPLGIYMGKIMNGEKTFMSFLKPVEKFTYKILRIDENEQMNWKTYLVAVLSFSIFGFILLLFLNISQGFLPLNPEQIDGTSWDLAFNTTASFVTNTNWQAYSGESTLSYFTQMLGLNVQNFVSAATSIAVLFAIIRAFVKVKENGLGSFWVDMTRTILYILLPLSIICTLAINSQGVVQTFRGHEEVKLLEPIEVENEDSTTTIVDTQILPLGPAASQIAIKQLGTNGGGFYGLNSTHPFENPTPFSNLFEMVALLLIPVGLCFTFGRNIKDMKQGFALFAAMAVMMLVAMAIVGWQEQKGTDILSQNGQVSLSQSSEVDKQMAGGNMEGKETRFGIATSATWAVWTTCASNGSVNSMHDSYTPIGGMIPMILMQSGEVVFGGTGCGLYGMLAFALITVFIAGLMVGRTPEYLGKKIEPYEMRMAMVTCLATPVAILIGSAIASLLPSTANSLNNTGTHGFSEVLYAYSSAGGNNGSAFAGFNANTPFLNISIGLVMLFVRFVPIICMLACAGSLVQKKKVAVNSGTLETHSPLFIGLLIGVVLIVAVLSFFPALSLGPIAEFLQ